MGTTDAKNLKVFTGRANPALAQKICQYLRIPIGVGRTELFPDGELIVNVEEDVRGRDCFVVQPTCHPVNAHLMELFVWIDTLRRASAKRVTAVIPYFGYARQDQKHAGRTPITAKLVANLLERSGADRVVAVDLHAGQVQGFFDIPVDHLSAAPIFAKWFRTLNLTNHIFVSPDVGNVKRAQAYAELVGGELCFIDKRRKSGSTTEAKHVIGDVQGKNVLIVDDMITTAGTIAGACKILRDNGARDIFIAATHAVFAPPAMDRLMECGFAKLAVTDSIPIGNRAERIKDRLVVLSVAEFLGEAINRIHHNESVSALFNKEANGA
ncbi:MAG: ribose-phosphate pyrophosphokinase [Tepidisphaeraceae bacterium]|jgi:ribose-phosphate pyrophosphokinase